MEALTDFEVPLYTHYHFEYYKQVAIWYMELHENKEHIIAHHRDREKHFEQWKSTRQYAGPKLLTEEYF